MKQTLTKLLLLLLTMLLAVGVDAAKKVHTIGDSTMAPYDESTTVTRGWGMYFGNFLTGDWTSVNYARGGRDARSGYNELWTQNAKSKVEAGDYVLVQFAHNDEMYNGVDHDELVAYWTGKGETGKVTDTRGTNPTSTYKELLKKICDEVKEKGATPILVGPACRFWFTDGKIRRSGQHDLGDKYDAIIDGDLKTGLSLPADDHTMDYAYQMKQLAEAEGITYIDLTSATKNLYENYGPEKCATELQSVKVENGKESVDGTHFRTTGALLVARLCAQLMKDAGVLADVINVPSDLTVAPESADMGDVYNGQTGMKALTINGFGLTPSEGTITVNADNGMELSLDKTNWSTELTIPYTTGTIVQDFYVRKLMTTGGAFSGNVTVVLGEKTINVPVSANVVELGGGEPFSVTWPLATDGNAVLEGTATYAGPTISGMGTRYKNNTLQAYGGSSLGSWSAAEDDDPNRYIEFSVTCPEGKELNINNIALKVGGVATNDICCHVYYSTDNYSTRTTLYAPTVMTSSVMNEVNATPVIKLEEGESVKVRIYPWSAQNYASGKYIAVSDVVISGQCKNAGGVEIEGSITYKLDKGGLNQGDDAIFDPADMTAGIIGKTWTAGSGLEVSGTTVFRHTKNDNSTIQATQTKITNNTGTAYGSAPADDNTLTLTITPEDGFNFVPSKVSFEAARYGTNSGNITAIISAGDNSADVCVNQAVARSDNNEDLTSFSKEGISNVVASGSEPLLVKFSFLGLAGNSKSMGISNLVIEGKIVGSAAQVTKYVLHTSIEPSAEAGSITLTPSLPSYKEGTQVTLKATKNFGYKFKEWQDANGNQVSTDAETTITMDAERTMKAVFEQVAVYTVKTKATNDAERDGMGSVTLMPNDHNGQYEEGTKITATANETKILKFLSWTDDNENASASKERELTVNGDMTLVANYEVQDFIAVFDASKTAAYDYEGKPFSADEVWDNQRNAKSCIVKQSDGTLVYTKDGGTPVVRNRQSVVLSSINGLYQNGYNTAEIAWQYQFSTVGFTSATFNADMAAKNAATKNWKAQYSVDGTTYNDLGEAWQMTANVATPLSFTLPADAIGKETVYVRIMGTGTDLLSDKYAFTVGEFCGLKYATNSESGVGNVYVLGEAVVTDDEQAPVVTATIPANQATGVSATGKITISFDERIESANSNAAVTLGSLVLQPTWSSRSVSFDYSQLDYGTAYTFTMPANYVQDKSGNKYAEAVTITFTTMQRPTVEKALYDFIVPDNGTIDEALAAANGRADKNVRYRVFIKNSAEPYVFHPTGTIVGGDDKTYDNPTSVLTAANTSFIGESTEGVVLTNITPAATWNNGFGEACPLEGIGKGDVLQIKGQNSYFQNLTIKTSMGDAHGRDIAVNDQSNRTIFKDACLWGYQDTYVSNNQNGKFYFEGGVIRGRTDYICGKGDAYYNKVTFRQVKSGYLAVPSIPKKYGYILQSCKIVGDTDDVNGTYTLGRPWGKGTPIALFIDTEMEVVPSAIGWSEMSGGYPARFAEYGSHTPNGVAVSTEGRKTDYDAYDSKNGDTYVNRRTEKNNPVLTAEEAAQPTLAAVMGQDDDWQPTLLTEQAPVPTDVIANGAELTWTDSDYALLYAICKDGSIVDFTTYNSYTAAENGTYTVRAANEMGGLSAESEAIVVSTATGITTMHNMSSTTANEVYDMEGRQLQRIQRGLNIVRMNDGRVVKVMNK